MPADIEAMLAEVAFDRDCVERFLDPSIPKWAKFDPELGYVLATVALKDGIDNSVSIYHYEPGNYRRLINYANEPCRINTYGDSFTQCHQVSDGETWQEILAAHFGEPIRNFGIGGHGVYQAYRNARRTEPTALGAEYIVLNIFYDDHIRNLDSCRWLRLAWFARMTRDRLYLRFHANPWAHLRYDLKKDSFVELPSVAPTEEALRALCDPQKFSQTFRDDQVLRLWTLENGKDPGRIDDLEAIAEAFDFKVDLRAKANVRDEARRFRHEYSIRSTEYVLDQMRAWLASAGKKLMVVLSYGGDQIIEEVNGRPRFDQRLIDYLERNHVLYVDSLAKHAADYQAFKCTPTEYTQRFYIGHYNPAGNHFFAYAIKNEMVEWLTPRPLTYRDESETMAHVVARLA